MNAVLQKAAANLEKMERRLRVTYDHRTDLLPFSQILYIEAQKQYVLIHTFDETYRMKRSFNKILEELDELFINVSGHSASISATSRVSKAAACC